MYPDSLSCDVAMYPDRGETLPECVWPPGNLGVVDFKQDNDVELEYYLGIAPPQTLEVR